VIRIEFEPMTFQFFERDALSSRATYQMKKADLYQPIVIRIGFEPMTFPFFERDALSSRAA
jgi:hypothetical protein